MSTYSSAKDSQSETRVPEYLEGSPTVGSTPTVDLSRETSSDNNSLKPKSTNILSSELD